MPHRIALIFRLALMLSVLFSLWGCQKQVETTTLTVTETLTQTVSATAAPVTITMSVTPVTTTITATPAPVTVTVTATATVTATNSQAPTIPVKTSPADKSIFSIYPRATTLKWNPSQGALPITYFVEVQYSSSGDYSNFGSWQEGDYGTGAFTSNVPVYTFNFVGAQPGKWRVKASNQYGVSDWSDWWYFRYTS